MPDPIGAPSGADVSGASSSATQPASTGRPTRNSITQSLKAKRVETPATEPASPAASTQTDGAPRADEPAKTEGDTANPEAGKGDKKPIEKAKDPESVPMGAFKKRLGEEKGRREKVEAELHASKGETAEARHLFEVAIQENERLTELLRASGKFDERGEELSSRELTLNVKDQLAKLKAEHQQALVGQQRESQIAQTMEQLRSEVTAACTEFPGVSPAEVRAALRANPSADIRQLAQAKHEERAAYFAKRSTTPAAVNNLPTTVAKPTGVSRFEAPLSAKGMGQAIRHQRSRG